MSKPLKFPGHFSCWTCPLPTVWCPPWPCLLSLFIQCCAGSFCPRNKNCANLPSENRDFLTEQLVKGLVSPSVEMILKVQLGGCFPCWSMGVCKHNIQTELSTVLSDKILILVSAAPWQLQYVCCVVNRWDWFATGLRSKLQKHTGFHADLRFPYALNCILSCS